MPGPYSKPCGGVLARARGSDSIVRAHTCLGTESRSYIPLLLIQASIEKTLSGMDRLGLRGETSGVYFGQLLGMADHLTLSLGSAGYKAYKCK